MIFGGHDIWMLPKVLVHGYGDYGRTGWVRNMKDAYLAKGKQYYPCPVGLELIQTLFAIMKLFV